MSKRDDHLGLARTDLEVCANNLPDAVRRIMDGRLGTPRASGGAGTSSSGGSSSPVERAVIGSDCTCPDEDNHECAHGTVPDPARATLAEVDRILNRLYLDSRRLRQIVESAIPHAPTAKDLREVASLNVAPAAECALTRELINQHEPLHRTSDCGGILSKPTPLSRWVYDFIRDQERTPTAQELQRHHDGLQVRVKA